MKARLLAFPLLLVGAGALAHVEMVVKGVHFKTEPIDFGQPPVRRGDAFDDGTGANDAWRPGTRYRRELWEVQEEREARDEADQKRLMRESSRTEGAKTYRELRRRDLADPNFLAGRLELLATPGIAGAKGLAAYLRATHPLTKGLLPADVGPLLRPWVAYARARTPGEYAAVARAYPASTRAAAALIMAARGEANVSRPAPGGLARARRAAETLLREHPSSRFAWDARGVLGRLDFLAGRYPAARARYEGQVRAADTEARKTQAFGSIIACLRPARDRAAIAHTALRWIAATDAADPYPARAFFAQTMGGFRKGDAPAFTALLAKDPAAFATYLELRQDSPTDLLRLAEPARRAAAGTAVRPRIDALLAQAALARGDARAALYARGAMRGRGDDHAVGAFVLATLDRRAGRYRAARAGFAGILRDHPASYLVGGARENLALVAEALGDLATAMDAYLALGYLHDVAYLADARMTPGELAAYVAAHPRQDALRYTLAMRHLRRAEWDLAQKALAPFSDAHRRVLTSGFVSPYQAERDGPLQDPLLTLRALRRLDLAVKAAQGPEAKARALVAMGDYYYSHKCLLLYSGPVWRSERDGAFAFSWNATVATAKDDAALRAHYDEHECYVQALDRYRAVLKDYPDSKVAPHAAYWAAVSVKRLSNMAPYWRWRDRREDLKAEAIRLMALAAESPDPALAAKAAKYGPVFASEREEARKAFANERPPSRRWNAEG